MMEIVVCQLFVVSGVSLQTYLFIVISKLWMYHYFECLQGVLSHSLFTRMKQGKPGRFYCVPSFYVKMITSLWY